MVETTVLPQTKSKAAWDPIGFFWVGSIFSFLPAGILWSFNYERLGSTRMKKITMPFVITGFIFYIILMYIFPMRITVPLNIFASIFFFISQKNDFKKYLDNGGLRASFTYPVSVCLTIYLIALLVYLIAGGTREQLLREMTNQIAAKNAMLVQSKGELIAEVLEGNFSSIEPLLLEYQKQNPMDGDIYWSLANLYVQSNQLPLALEQLKKLKEIHPNYQEEKYDPAENKTYPGMTVDQYLNIVQRYMDDPKSYKDIKEFNDSLNAVQSHLQSKNYEAVEYLLAKFRKIFPDDLRLHLQLARAYVKANEYQKAMEELDQAFKISPNSPGAKELSKEVEKNFKTR